MGVRLWIRRREQGCRALCWKWGVLNERYNEVVRFFHVLFLTADAAIIWKGRSSFEEFQKKQSLLRSIQYGRNHPLQQRLRCWYSTCRAWYSRNRQGSMIAAEDFFNVISITMLVDTNNKKQLLNGSMLQWTTSFSTETFPLNNCYYL